VRRGAGWLTALLLTVPAACGTPAGVDGKLVDDWKAMPQAEVAVPPIGACYATVVLETGTKVSCDAPHVVETYHVAQFPPEVARRMTIPPAGGPELRAAFADCEARAREFLGGEWYAGRLDLIFTPVNARQWEGGGRHYRCDLAELKTAFKSNLVPRTSSMRDGLRGQRPLASACYDFVDEVEDRFRDLNPVDCGAPHDAEYAGVFEAIGAAPPDGDERQDEIGFRGCGQVVAAYLGGTLAGLQVFWTYTGFDPDDWARGDRRVRCYVTRPDTKKLIGSAKGIGNGRPPTA